MTRLTTGTARSWRAALTAGVVLAAAAVVGLAPAAAAAPPVVTPVGTIGQSGHAQLYGWGLATEADGNILVSDYWNFRVARYAPDGTFLRDLVTTANKGSANNEEPAPELHQSPYGLAVDPVTGDFYFGDVDGGKTVDKYDQDGNFLLAFGGNGTGLPGKFRYPSRLTVGADRRVYVADQWDHVVSVHDPDGKELFAFGGNGTAPGKFRQPRGLAFDGAGRLFVVDDYNHRVQVFDVDATSARFLFAFGSKGDQPGQFAAGADMRGLAVDTARGWVYVVDAASGYVSKFDTSGRFLTRWGGFGSGPGKFPGGGREVTVDRDGNVWVADMPGFRVQKFSPDGELLQLVPDPAGPPPLGGFNQPRGVAVDAQGRVFVSDTHNFRVQRFDAQGRADREWGHRGGTGLGFNYARGIAVDRRNGDVVVADTDNHKIAKFTGDGVLRWEVGGFGTVLGKFTNPHGLDVGPDGRIYVADTQNGRVVVLDEDGGALSVIGSKGTGKGQFQFNRDVVVDPADQSLWVSDSQRGKVQHFTNSGTYLGELGALGSADHQLKRAADVQVHGEHVYVADVDTHRIKVWSKDGQFQLAFGGGGSGAGQMFNPHGMDVTPDGLLYVAEQTGERISVFRLQSADTSAADTTLDRPAAGAALPAGVVVLAGGATDDRGVAAVDVSVKDDSTSRWWTGSSWSSSPATVGAVLSGAGQPQTGWSVELPSVSSGSYTVAATARDAAGNADPSPAQSAFTVSGQAVDTVAPDGTVAFPRAKQVVPAGAVQFSGAATDDVGVTDVRVAVQDAVSKAWWNGSTWGTGITWLSGAALSAPGATSLTWSYRWVPPAAGGSFGMTVRAADAAGNLDTTRPFVGFTSPGAADAQPADTAITTPADGAVVPAGDIAVTGTATDDLAVAGVRVAVQDLGTQQWWTGSSWTPERTWREAGLSGAGAAEATWSSSFTARSPGRFAVHAEARDSTGNADPAPALVTVEVQGSAADTVAPDGTVAVPTRLQVFPAGPVRMNGAASDDVGVTAVRVGIQNATTKRWWDGRAWVSSNGWYLTAALATPGGSSTTWSYDWTPPAGGSYSLTVRAEDAAGNVDGTRPFIGFTTG